MRSATLRSALAVLAAAALAGCAGRKKGAAAGPADGAARAGARGAGVGGSADGKVRAGLPREEEASLRDKTFAPSSGLEAVRFEYDSSELSEEALKALRANAAWLKARPEAEIRVEGHCDDRGTIEYNIALGQRRATVVRDYYRRLGVKMRRMSTISFGEEKPECEDPTEDCWARNRRAATFLKGETP